MKEDSTGHPIDKETFYSRNVKLAACGPHAAPLVVFGGPQPTF
jgi:hypothetical protein